MGGHSSRRRITPPLKQPTRTITGETPCLIIAEKARRPYSVLLPVGFTVPPAVAGGAVRSYRTLSLFTGPKPVVTCSLLHFPWGRPAGS